jgi:hypothetical protein
VSAKIRIFIIWIATPRVKAVGPEAQEEFRPDQPAPGVSGITG